MTDRIERELLVPACPEELWEVVTGPSWLAEEVELDLIPGGDACFRSRRSVKTGWVEEVSPPDVGDGRCGRLAFWWAADDDCATRVELTLEPVDDDATLVRVVESRPLDLLDLVGIPLRGAGGRYFGPALIAS